MPLSHGDLTAISQQIPGQSMGRMEQIMQQGSWEQLRVRIAAGGILATSVC